MDVPPGRVIAADVQPQHFKFTQKALEEIKELISRYPEGRQASALLPVLMIAQREHQNWLPKAAMDTVAELLDMPAIKVYEVATFYSMYNLKPKGKYHVQLCTTTPCWLRGSDAVLTAAKEHLGVGLDQVSKDGLFSLEEVECLGACVNAPMCQVKSADHDAYYEDLDAESIVKVLKELAEGRRMKTGSRIGRTSSEPVTGPTSLMHQRDIWEKNQAS